MNNLLIRNNEQITDSNLYKGISYDFNINSESDLTVGTVASSRITFVTDSLTSSSIGQTWIYKKKHYTDNDFVQVGVYTISEATKSEYGKYNVVAYDNVSKLDKDISDLLERIQWGSNYLIRNLFWDICTECEIPYSTDQFTNYNIAIPNKPVSGESVNARSVMEYIAAVAGGFIIADETGKITVKSFTDNNTVIDQSKYKKLVFADYTTQPILGVRLATDSTDVGITYPADTTEQLLNITYNPLFNNEVEAIATQAVANIYNKVKSDYASYVPCKIELLSDFGIKPGERITVKFTRDGVTTEMNTLVFNKKISASGVTLESSGRANRDASDNSISSEIKSLIGKSNRFERTLDATTSTIEDLSKNLSSTVKQEVDKFTVEIQQDVNEATEKTAALELTVNNFSTRITNAETNSQTAIEQSDSAISAVASKIDSDDGASIILAINNEGSSAKISADKVNVSGFVTFEGLANGTTTIDGGCIKTGNISAERIDTSTINLVGNIYRKIVDGVKYFLIGINSDRNLQIGSPSPNNDYTNVNIYTGDGGKLNVRDLDNGDGDIHCGELVATTDIKCNNGLIYANAGTITKGLAITGLTKGAGESGGTGGDSYKLLCIGSEGDVYLSKYTQGDIGTGGSGSGSTVVFG